MNVGKLKINKHERFREQYETCIFMARVAEYVIAAFAEDDYDHALYDKVDKILARLDSNKKAKGFIGPQSPSFLIWLMFKKNKFTRYAFSGFWWFKGFYTKDSHQAYQVWCQELYNARFTEKEIDEIYRVTALPDNNNCYDETGSKAWRMLINS